MGLLLYDTERRVVNVANLQKSDVDCVNLNEVRVVLQNKNKEKHSGWKKSFTYSYCQCINHNKTRYYCYVGLRMAKEKIESEDQV